MRPFRIYTLASAFLCFSVSLLAQPELSTAPATVKIESVSLQSVQPDRIELLAKLGLIPERSLKVKALSFSAMKVNGMPVYVGPIDGEFAMKKDEYLRLPDVRITVYYRDLNSVEPARRLVEQQKVIISGQITARMEANPFEQIAMHSLHPKVVLPFNKEIPVLIPGGEVGGQGALALLDMVAPVGQVAAQLLNTIIMPGQDAAWRNEVGTEEAKHLVLIRTSYTVVDDKASYPLEFEQLGFWVGPSTVIAPEEAVEPWEFDPDAKTRLSENHAHVDKDSVAVTVQPMAGSSLSFADTATNRATQWSLKSGDFTIETEGKPAKDHVAHSTKITSVEVRERASSNNYALLRFRDGVVGSPVKLAWAADASWDRLAILRLVRNQVGKELRTEVVMLPGTSDGKQIKLGDQIDDSGFGSPVFTRDGVIAMLQDENSAVLLSSIKHLEEKAK